MRPGYRNRRYIASGKRLACSHIDKNISSSQAIHFCRKSTGYCRAVSKSPGKCKWFCSWMRERNQALERTQPMLPLGLGYVEGVTHDYRRHGTPRCSPHWTRRTAKCSRNVDRVPASGISEFSPGRLKRTSEELGGAHHRGYYATHKHLRVRRWFATGHGSTYTSLQPMPPG